MNVPLALGSFKRSLLPEAVLLNCYAEANPTSQANSMILRSRAGMSAFQTVGTGPIRCFMTKAGLWDGDALLVSSTTFYRLASGGSVTALTGTISGTASLDIDADQDSDLASRAWIATGSALLKASGVTVTAQDFPEAGGAGATSVACSKGFVLAVEAGTDKVYYLSPGGTTWNAFDFASAEYSADRIIAVRTVGDLVALLGSDTTEIWQITGGSPAIEPFGGLKFDFGCRSRDAAVNVAGTLIWVDHRCDVRMFQGGDAVAISDHGLSEQIRQVPAADLRASWYQTDGHRFYVLTLGTEATWVYDLGNKQWHRRSSAGLNYCRAVAFATMGDETLAADATGTQVYRIEPELRTDAGSTFTVEFTAFAEVLEGRVPCANVELVCEVGNAPRSGQGSDPLIRLRWSDDGGKTWSAFRNKGLGATGEYSTRVKWNALGTIKAPRGRIFHWQVSDPVGRRFSSAQMNAVG